MKVTQSSPPENGSNRVRKCSCCVVVEGDQSREVLYAVKMCLSGGAVGDKKKHEGNVGQILVPYNLDCNVSSKSELLLECVGVVLDNVRCRTDHNDDGSNRGKVVSVGRHAII